MQSRYPAPTRRTLLGWGGRVAGTLAAIPLLSRARRAFAGKPSAPVPQPARATPEAFAARAIEMRDLAVRTGDQGYGAVIVKDGRIIGQAPSRVVFHKDPTAHAEMEALRDAAKRVGRAGMRGAVMYGSARACAMCEAGAYWAGIGELRHGASARGGDAPRLRKC